jgi:muramoyltetrapeptide carboxypeptidase
MIVGGMSDMNDNTVAFGRTAEEIILDYTEDYDFPICFGFPAGHLDDNRSILLGVSSVLEINENGVSLSQE